VTDPLGPFDSNRLAAVAADRGVAADALEALVRRHHAHADSMPGVDELVFEWRRFLGYDPLVARTDDAYHLAVDESIWREFGEQMGLDEEAVEALMTLHDREARAAVGADGSTAPYDRRAAMVLAR
jgi:hypothetical protein